MHVLLAVLAVLCRAAGWPSHPPACCRALLQAENEALRQQLRKSESLRRKSHRALLGLQQVRAAHWVVSMHELGAAGSCPGAKSPVAAYRYCVELFGAMHNSNRPPLSFSVLQQIGRAHV